MFATRGCLPFNRFEAKTQSPGCEYGVLCFQQHMNSASNEWSETGPFEALVLGKPTCPHVQVRRTWITHRRSSRLAISLTSSASPRLPVVRYRVRFWCPILAASDSSG